ncbi:MAG: protein kinase, partial [Rhodothermales bacterium]
IEEKLGGGGMGVVYKARDLKLKRAVALKFLPPELTRDEEAKQRFMHEAQAASALDHVNVGSIHEIDEAEDGRLFIAMAYYAGETLKYCLADGLSVGQCVDIAVQVARGLAKAHEAGIVHRDIKPANVMVTEDGVVKIVDFGLAKVAAQTQLTKTGSTLGTVAYMSPEQARGEVVDERTDLWALGVVLYEMLTGQRPFRGDYDAAVVYSILNEEPKPVAALNAEAPEGLVQVVEKLLQKDPAERYQRVEDLLPDLKAFRSADTESVSVQAMEAAPVVPSMWRWVTMGIPVVLILLGGLWALWRFGFEPAGPVTPGARTAIAVLPFEVQGGEDLAYLEEGMVTLLATKLDGAGTLRSVDPKALRGYLARNPDRVLDPQAGREAAVHFGAGSFILGTVLRAGTETQLLASLYDTEGTELAEAQASFANDEQFMAAVDALAQQLVAVFLDEVDQQMASLATGTTTSFSALKAYLEAEQAMRDERFQDAVEAARQAVEADSTFALGWYLLDQALAWVGLGLTAEQDTAKARALQYSDGLTDRAKTLIEASGAFNAGTVDEAERLYRSLLATYPDDIEAWGGLGDLLYHYNPLRGRPAAEALPYFQRVLFYDPDNSEFSSHLMLIAGKER